MRWCFSASWGRGALLLALSSASALAAAPADSVSRDAVILVAQGGAGPASIIELPRLASSVLTWSVEKSEEGVMLMSGMVPDIGAKTFLASLLGKTVQDDTVIDGEAPEGFLRLSAAALRAVNLLSSGKAVFDGERWVLSGVAASDEALDSVRNALKITDPNLRNWSVDVAIAATAPPPAEPEAPVADAGEPSPQPAEPASPVAITEPEPVPEPVTETAIAPQEPGPAPASAAPAALPPSFSASKRADGMITLSGQVPSEPARRYLNTIAGTTSIDRMQVAAGEPGSFMPSVNAGLRALQGLGSGELKLSDGKWSLSGTAPDTASERRARDLIAALPDAAGWSVGIEGPSPFTQCAEALVAFDERNPLLFRSGSAVLAEASLPALEELAGYLVQCPMAAVHVEGHTDSDGPEETNLVLSVSRAEAVVTALVERGISADRLYAIGYGESLPIASNDTQDGKQRNRRIVVTVLEE